MTERLHCHCEERSDEAIHSFLRHGLLRCARNDGEAWIASRSLSSGAHSRDPLARNDGEGYTVIARSEATKQSSLSLRGEMDCFAALAMTERVTPSVCEDRHQPANRPRQAGRHACKSPAASPLIEQ